MMPPAKPDMRPDWRTVFDVLRSHYSGAEICRAMGLTMLSERMVQAYYSGDREPLTFRGLALLRLWSARTGQPMEAVPMVPVVRGHRRARQPVDRSPQMQSLPAWPPAPQPSVRTIKRRNGR